MSLNDPTNIIMAVPAQSMDQIVDVITGSFVVPAATGTGSAGTYAAGQATVFKPMLNNDEYLFKGLWSIDSGSTWKEFGNKVVVGSDPALGSLIITTGASNGIDNTVSPLVCLMNISSTNGGYSVITVQYKILVMARFDQDNVPSKVLLPAIKYSTKNNYMKILFDNVVPLSPSATTAITHNLNRYPNFNVWILTHFISPPDDFVQMDYSNSSTIITLNTLILPKGSAAGGGTTTKAYYRIYSDD